MIIARDDAAVTSFEDLALALRRVACLAANKVAAIVDDFELTEQSDAVALSTLMIEVVKVAAELDEGVLTRLRMEAERRTINDQAVAPQPAAKSNVDSVVAMFRQAGRAHRLKTGALRAGASAAIGVPVPEHDRHD